MDENINTAQQIIDESVGEELTEDEIKEIEVKVNKEIEKEVK